MSNNRSSNRRRGRGGNRSQGGGGNQLNRIDSRARGNAPQLLEKYKKLAHDASMNGDRVQAEYYLQFADHYFRVMADSRAQRDEQRPRREFDREQHGDDDDFYGDEERAERPSSERERSARSESEEGQHGSEGADSPDDEENPFTRREPREARREARPKGEARGERRPRGNGNGHANDRAEQESAGLDPSILPPAIGGGPDEDAPSVEEKPRRARRPRSRPASEGEGDANLEAVG